MTDTARAPLPATLMRVSIAVALVVIALKLVAWWVSGSVGLLSDAMESLVNLASALFGLVMVDIARRPADHDHPWGHTKAEYFSSGFEALLILAAAGAIVWTATERLLHPRPLQAVGSGVLLSIAASAINGALAWLMLRSARAHRSIALEGGARHLLTDVWTSVGVVAGLGLGTLTGWLWIDPAVAIVVALHIALEAARLMWKSSQGLMDQAIGDEARADVERALAGSAHAAARFDHIVTRRAGHRLFVDLHMHLPAMWTLGRAAAERARVEDALMAAVPGLRASIQLLPHGVEPHLDERAPGSEAAPIVGRGLVERGGDDGADTADAPPIFPEARR